MAPTVIACNVVYNAILNGVIQAGENEAAGVEQMSFYEVAPQLRMTRHAITIRALCFSAKTFKALPKDLQDAVVRAGKDAATCGREVESGGDSKRLDEFKAHSTQPRHQYRLSYGVGDVVIWDKASLLHAAALTDPRHARTLWRITVKPT